MGIEQLVVELSNDPFNAEKNFNAAIEYECINQTASAVSFYLRAVEYGTDADRLFVYTSLLKMARCFNDQNGREHSVTNAILQAMAVCPERPEAYFLLARYHERAKNWQEAYTFACVGLKVHDVAAGTLPDLPADVEYHGVYCLHFEKAVAGWWVGRPDESRFLFRHLLNDYAMNREYVNACLGNLQMIGG